MPTNRNSDTKNIFLASTKKQRNRITAIISKCNYLSGRTNCTPDSSLEEKSHAPDQQETASELHLRHSVGVSPVMFLKVRLKLEVSVNPVTLAIWAMV